ncbi:major capsid protein P2 [Shewanella baltica]|uniref:major capsid protein P2 n=1 Tax=Shewanella baltica TaxID=62322 RepID=UPI003D7BEE7D
MRTTVKLPSFSNVAAGNTATLELPIGRTYDKIHIAYTGVTLAQMKNIRLEVNGKAILEFKDGQALADYNKFYKRNTANGILDLHFKRDELKTLLEARMFGLGTMSGASGVISNVTLRIEIDAAAAAPTLEGWAIQSDKAEIGYITKVKNFPVALNTGVTEIDKIPRPASASIAAIHIVTTAAITKVELEMDSLKAFEGGKTLIEKIQVDHGRSPQAGRVTLDFVLEGDMLQAIPLAGLQDLRIRVYTDDAAAATVVVEYFDGLAGI